MIDQGLVPSVEKELTNLAEGDFKRHIENGVDLNPFSTTGARHEWQQGFEGKGDGGLSRIWWRGAFAARCVKEHGLK